MSKINLTANNLTTSLCSLSWLFNNNHKPRQISPYINPVVFDKTQTPVCILNI